jgi:O-antigen ligase
MEAMKSEEYRQKVERGPVAFMTVIDKNRVFNMTSPLAQWFLYSVLVGILAAYLAGRTFGPGAEYLDVFRVTGTVAFAGYAMALMQRSIWFAQRWSVTLKSMFDGLVYALVTAGTFGWLWPAA